MIVALRIVGAFVAAVVTALALLIAVEVFSSIVHPPPTGFAGSHEEMCEHVANYPAWVLAAVVPMWGFIAFASVWIAGRIGYVWCGLFIGALLFAAAAMNLAMLPYPVWFKVAMPAALLIAVAIGAIASFRPKAPAVPTA